MDKRTSVEIEPFVGHGTVTTVMAEVKAFRRLEKMQYFIIMSVTDMPRVFHYWRYKNASC